MSVDYLPILNETSDGFKNKTVRFRTKFKKGDSAHGNYLEMGEIKVPTGIETVILSIVSDDFSTHPNWLFVMPIQKTKLRFEPKKLDRIILDVRTDSLEFNNMDDFVTDGEPREPNKKKEKIDWFGEKSWDSDKGLLSIGKGKLQLNVIKGKDNAKTNKLHKLRLKIEYQGADYPRYSDVIFDSVMILH